MKHMSYGSGKKTTKRSGAGSMGGGKVPSFGSSGCSRLLAGQMRTNKARPSGGNVAGREVTKLNTGY